MSACISFVKRYLCVKRLTIHDGFTAKSVKLPRAEARFFMGELRNRQAIPVVLLDEQGSCWELLCTCMGGQYALSRIGAFCETHEVKPGCYFIFYADHDHIVRLAVRQELPEDVQAALNAARAALAARTNAQEQAQEPRAAQQSPSPSSQGAHAARLEMVAAKHAPSQAVLDDPVALDEMPPCATVPSTHATERLDLPAHTAAAAAEVVSVLAAVECPRAMPLQDRSNLPATTASCVVAEAAGAGKAKPLGAKSVGKHAVAVASGTNAGALGPRSLDCNKENEPAGVMPLPAAGKVPACLPASPITSTGGLSPPTGSPANTSPGNHCPLASSSLTQQPQNQQQHQSRTPRPGPSPAAPSPHPVRSAVAVVQPPPSPATRLRMRFEARLRAQAGKPHPLSVRSSPESPLPQPPGHGAGFGLGLGFLWSPVLAGPHPLRPAPGFGPSMLPAPWTGGGWQSRCPGDYGSGFGLVDADSQAGCVSKDPGVSSGSYGGGAYRSLSADGNSGSCEGGTGSARHAGTTHTAGGSTGASVGEAWGQQLQCEELLDSEVGKSAEVVGAVGGNTGREDQYPYSQGFFGRGSPRDHQPASAMQSPASQRPTLSGWLPQCPAAHPSQPVGLAALHHMLTNKNVPAMASDGQEATCSSGSAGRGPLEPGQGPQPLAPPVAAAAAWAPQQRQSSAGGVLMSLAATGSSLRQLLSAGASAAAWNLAAMTGRAPGYRECQPGQAGAWVGPGRGFAAGGIRSLPQDASRPPSWAPQSAAGVESGTQEGSGNADGVFLGSQVFGARAKSGLSIGRGALGAPAELPCGKRHRPYTQQPTPGDHPLSAPDANTSSLDPLSQQLSMTAAGPEARSLSQPGPGASAQLPPSGRQLAAKALTAQELLSGHVELTMDAGACSWLAATCLPPTGAEAADVRAGGGGGCIVEAAGGGSAAAGRVQPMEIDGLMEQAAMGAAGSVRNAVISAEGDLQTATKAEPRATNPGQEGTAPHQQEAGRFWGTVLRVDVVVESGAVYEGVLLLQPREGAGDPGGCELRGLLPYLIRRESGVGDVLALWVNEDDRGTGRLRVCASLRRR